MHAAVISLGSSRTESASSTYKGCHCNQSITCAQMLHSMCHYAQSKRQQLRPVLLLAAGAMKGTQVHAGFWEGAKQHIEDIKQVVQQQNSQAGRRLPVWITGHSLGGGYANCMMLHLLASKRTADIFSAGEQLTDCQCLACIHSDWCTSVSSAWNSTCAEHDTCCLA